MSDAEVTILEVKVQHAEAMANRALHAYRLALEELEQLRLALFMAMEKQAGGAP